MVDRGSILQLQPDKYPKHAELAKRLDRLPSWDSREPVPKVKKEVDEPVIDDGLLPHQREVIEKIKRNRDLQTES